MLDFKAPARGKPGALFTIEGKLTTAGRIATAKALSAFSNSAGGVIVIGVDCRLGDDKIDRAQALDPVPNWRAALSSLSSAVGDLLQPKNSGIRVEGFPSEDDASLGYLIIDVPQSERRPHRSEASDNKQYFKRSGSASYAMEHFDIEDAFKRVTTPNLTLHTSFHKNMGIGLTTRFHLRFWLRNVSTVSAFYPSLTLESVVGVVRTRPVPLPGVIRMQEDEAVTAYGNSEFVIHPSSSRQIDAIEFDALFDNYGRLLSVGGVQAHMAYLAFKFRISAKDMRMNEGELEIPLNKLTSIVVG